MQMRSWFKTQSLVTIKIIKEQEKKTRKKKREIRRSHDWKVNARKPCCSISCKAEWISETAPKWTSKNNFFKKFFQILALKSVVPIWRFLKNCCIHRPKWIKATVWFQHWRWRVETNTKRSGYRFRGHGRNVSKQQWFKHSTYNLFIWTFGAA